MLHRIELALVVLLSVALLSAHKAQIVTDVPLWDSGSAFLSHCHQLGKPHDEITTYQVWSEILCTAYLNGLGDGVGLEITLSNQSGTPLSPPYCLPPDVKEIQQGLVLIKYIQDNFAQAHLPTATLYGRAMKAAFPCPAH